MHLIPLPTRHLGLDVSWLSQVEHVRGYTSDHPPKPPTLTAFILSTDGISGTSSGLGQKSLSHP